MYPMLYSSSSNRHNVSTLSPSETLIRRGYYFQGFLRVRSNLAGRVGSGRIGSSELTRPVRFVERPDPIRDQTRPLRFPNLLTRPDLARDIYKRHEPDPT